MQSHAAFQLECTHVPPLILFRRDSQAPVLREENPVRSVYSNKGFRTEAREMAQTLKTNSFSGELEFGSQHLRSQYSQFEFQGI